MLSALNACNIVSDPSITNHSTEEAKLDIMSSTPSSQLLTQRHQQLYGKGRCARFQAIQTLQQEDHVKQSFRRGVRPVPSRETFQSITARDYKVWQSIKAYHHIMQRPNSRRSYVYSTSPPLPPYNAYAVYIDYTCANSM